MPSPPTVAELQRRLAESQEEVKRLKKAQAQGLALKVSDKGAVSLYGVSKYPVTYYANQWRKIVSMGDAILAFIAEHDAVLAKPAP